MSKRPKPEITPGAADKGLELLGGMLIAALWIYTALNYAALPETIPMHFNITGDADAFGPRATILILPVLATLLYIALAVLGRFPHRLNYPWPITPENAREQYTLAVKTLRYVRIILVAVFGLIAVRIVENIDGPGALMLPLIMGGPLLPVVIFLIKGRKIR